MRRHIVAIVACLVGLVAARTAAADDRTARADALFREGRALINQHDDAAACAKFAAANELDPDAAGTLLNLGLCNEHQGKLRSALHWYRKAQLRAHETHLPDYERAAGERTTDLAPRVATVRIAFASGEPPPGARVTVDDDAVAPEDWARVELDPGVHVFVAEAPDRTRDRKELAIGAGTSSETLTFSLELVAGAARHRRHQFALGLGAGGLALAATSIVVTLHARSLYRDCLAGAAMPPAACGGEDGVAYANHEANVARYAGTSLAVAGVLAIGIAAGLWITAPREAAVRVAPTTNGVAIVGTF